MVDVPDIWIICLQKPEGLQISDSTDCHETVKRNMELMTHCVHEKMGLMTKAGVLEGITVHSIQEFFRTVNVSGAQEKLDALKRYLEASDIGSLVKNTDFEGF